MAEVVWTPRAYADLEAIGTYYAKDAPGYAELIVRKLMRAAERLEAFPSSGRVVPEIGGEGVREIVHRNYRIVYFHAVDENRVEVLTVFHSSRQFGRLPGEASD